MSKPRSPRFSRQSAERLPFKALALLRGVGMSATIRAALARAGYTQVEHDYAWRLLLQVSSRDVPIPPAPRSPDVGAAMAELGRTSESLVRRARAVLERHHPAQGRFVLANLEPGRGAEAVLSVGTLLTRLDALEHDAAREATRADDHAALGSLASRGITKDERDRLARLLTAAQAVELEPPAPAGQAEQYARDLAALHVWLKDWSETARAVLGKRDLIRLGLAKRRVTLAPGVKGTDIAGSAGARGPEAGREA